MKWQIAVTTVPERKGELLPQTLASLKAGGFEVNRMFVDGAASGDGIATFREPRIRTFGNWLLALAEMYIREPHADRYMIAQDDFCCVKNLRQYLDATKLPLERGYLNLLTQLKNNRVIFGKPSGTWHQAECVRDFPPDHPHGYGKGEQTGLGAVALVFSRDGAIELLSSPSIWLKPQDKAAVGTVPDLSRGHVKVDGAVVAAMNLRGYREYVHCPSLVRHTGEISVLRSDVFGKTTASPFMDVGTYPGDDFDAMRWLR